jgi:hypothetical protein
VGDEWASNGERKRAAEPSQAPAPVPTTAEAPVAAPAARAAVAAKPAQSRVGGTPSSSLGEENRMYQSALDARNHGDDRKALELFAAVIARYPDGHYGELAQVERMRALKRTGDRAAAAAEARRYLSERGHEFAREEVRGIALGDK